MEIDGDTGSTKNTKGKENQIVTNFLSKKIIRFVYNRLSYREKETEVTAKRHYAEIVFANGSYTGVRNFRFVFSKSAITD